MNKSVKTVRGWIFISIVLCTLLFSCENFLSSDGLEDFYKALEYVNADSFNVRFSAEGGKISPSGDYPVKVVDKINLIFNPESEKCFINWEVYSGNKLLSKEETEKYIHFDNFDEPETTIQICQKADNLKIQAKTVDRPKIVSTTPLYDDEGAYRDRRITIMFDQYLDRDSIYFTKEELIEAGVWDSAANCAKSGYTLLDKNGDKKYFGYQKTGDDDSIVWKVVTITKRTDKSANLLKCYECPEFDMYDTSILRINSKTEVLKMPPVNSDILVNIKTNFGVQEKSVSGAKKLVSLNSAYAWSYLTNTKYDNEAPVITELVLYNVKDGDKDFSTIQKNDVLYQRDEKNKENKVDIKTLIEKDPVKENNYLKYNLSQGKMWVKATVNDTGSGVKSLKAEITKVDTALYPCDEEKKIPYVAYNAKLNAVGPNSFVHSTDDNGEFFDVSGLQEDGLYRLVFTAKDNNEKTCTEETYFFYDGIGPYVSEKMTYERPEATKANISWKNPAKDDFWKVEVYTQDTKGNETLQTWDSELTPQIYIKDSSSFMADTSYTKFIENLKEGTKYQHKVLFYDYAGNITEKVLDIDNEAPTLKTNITECRKEAGKTTLSYALNEPDYWKAEIYTQKLPENTNTLQTWEVNTAETVLRPSNYKSGEAFGNEVTGLESNKLEAGNKYQHKVVLIDYSGNKSDPIDVDIDNTPPNTPVVYVGGMNEGLRVSTDCSYDKDIDYVEISGTDSIKLESVREKGVYAAKFTNKTNGVNYSYSVQTTDYAGNKSPITTVSGTPGIAVGYYCYLINDKDIIFSQKILNGGKNLVGIVISDSVDSKTNIETAKIMRITVDENKSVVYSHPNTAVYDGTYGAGVDNQTDHGEIFYQSIVNNNKLEDFPKIKHLYYDVNNENKNIITWYLPGLNELLPLNGYWSGPTGTINTSLSKIPSNIKHMGWLGDGMSEMVSCTFNNDDSSTPKFSVVYFNRVDYSYYKLKSYSTHATKSLLMARINPAY